MNIVVCNLVWGISRVCGASEPTSKFLLHRLSIMPLDLSPCDVGVPTCQPTFDLTKKQFMPHKNGKRVRDMVKTKQESHVDEAFSRKVEASMVKWRPLLVYRRGTAATENTINESVGVFQSIENWWHCRKIEVPDTESDSLSYFYDQGDTTQVRHASDTICDTMPPFTFPRPTVTPADVELIANNEKKVYQQYYSHPMAPEYISLSHSPHREDKLSPFHVQQIRADERASRRYVDWTNPCMACALVQRH